MSDPKPEAIEAFLALYPNRDLLKILDSLILHTEGRSRIAASFLGPLQLNVDYLQSTSKPLKDIEYPMEGRLRECQLFLAAVPEDEQTFEPFLQLKSLLGELEKLIKEHDSQEA